MRYATAKQARGVRWIRGAVRRVLTEMGMLRERLSSAALADVLPEPSDLMVVPEVMYGVAEDAFPDIDKVLLVQGHFLLLERWSGFVRSGKPAPTYRAYLATSEACVETCRTLGLAPVFLIPLYIDFSTFVFGETKQMQIAYMPRKRANEIEVILAILRRRGAIDGVDIVSIDRMASGEVASRLRSALIFLSTSWRDGFGLPPAEAMASGCIVIGYTGHGGDEFFDTESGIPIEENRPLQFAAVVENALAEYRRDPARLDALRCAAARRIRSRYTVAATRAALLDARVALSRGPAPREVAVVVT
jgi:glycosyltransferase involved in cell wall biosynthesis